VRRELTVQTRIETDEGCETRYKTVTDLSLIYVLTGFISVCSFPLSPKNVPENTEPIEEKRLLRVVRHFGAGEIVGDLDLVTILPIGQIGVDSIHVPVATMSWTRLARTLDIKLDGIVLQKSTSKFMMTLFEEVIVYTSVKLG
jgi:hypothetical protein